MDLPKRPEQHVLDSKGVLLFQSLFPDICIFRQLSERDYGIDGLLELSFDGRVTALQCSVQIKSSANIIWTMDNRNTINVSKSTVNYWMSSRTPVFIFLVDIVMNNVYFINVHRRVRQHFHKLIGDNKTFPFSFRKDLDFVSENGKVLFLYDLSNEFSRFSTRDKIKEIIMNWKDYYEHMLFNQCRDPFLFVKEEVSNKTFYLIKLLDNIAQGLFVEFNYVTFNEILQENEKCYDFYYKDRCYELLEHTHDRINRALQERFEMLIGKIKEHVLVNEGEFWKYTEDYIYKKCQEIDLNEFKKLSGISW